MKLLIIFLIIIILALIYITYNQYLIIDKLKNKKINNEKKKLNLNLSEAKQIVLDILDTAYSKIDNNPTSNILRIKDIKIRSALIGSSGRNLKLLEKLTNTDITLDNKDDMITISCFNPIKREIATLLIKELITSSKINASIIEEKYEKYLKIIEKKIFDKGQEAFIEVNLKEENQDIIYNIGKLYFRYSFGQNVLTHSIETAKIMGKIAYEFNLDVDLAKRAGLFHDIGKAFDIEKEGSHVNLGVEYARKIKEDNIIIDSIASHHGDIAASNVISAFVPFADKLSASRPGARKKTQEKLLSRVKQMEQIATRHKDVKEAYVIKGGKEIRVLIKAKSEKYISDIGEIIKTEFQQQLKFPGSIKIVVIKENRYAIDAMQNKKQ